MDNLIDPFLGIRHAQSVDIGIIPITPPLVQGGDGERGVSVRLAEA